MITIESRNEKEIVALLKHLDNCKITVDDKPQFVGSATPERKPGTCSTCPHFTSARSEYGRDSLVKFGMCDVYRANVNEHKSYCAHRKEEIAEKFSVA